MDVVSSFGMIRSLHDDKKMCLCNVNEFLLILLKKTFSCLKYYTTSRIFRCPVVERVSIARVIIRTVSAWSSTVSIERNTEGSHKAGGPSQRSSLIYYRLVQRLR